MDYVGKIYSETVEAEAREHAYRARSKRARGWARLISLALFAVFLMAVWQHRALAPPVHDGMVRVKTQVEYALENSDSARDFVRQAVSRPSRSSIEAEFDPITAWLLKWRN